MWGWETASERANREANEAAFGCLWPVIILFVVLAFIGHVFVKAGDAIYYPIVQNLPFTESRKVENWLREVFGQSYIQNIQNKDIFLSSFAESSQRARIVSDVQKVEDRFFAARLFLFMDPLPKQYESLLKTWKEDEWKRKNIDKIFLENVRFNTLFLRKDLDRDERVPLFSYLLSNGRITINKTFAEYLKSESQLYRDAAKKRLEEMRSKFRIFNAELPSNWEKRIATTPELKKLTDLNFNQMIIPFGFLVFCCFAYAKNKKTIAQKAVQENLQGVRFSDGDGVPQNDIKAVEFFSLAAKKGNMDAQRNLGFMYEYGRGVPQDYAKAMELYKKAAKKGHVQSQNSLGIMLELGRGVPKNLVKAAEWYRKAAERNCSWGQFNLGVYYEEGLGVPQDETKAFSLFDKSAQQGNQHAQCRLAKMYLEGRGVGKDSIKAAAWYWKAAEQDNLEAQFQLALLYFQGLGVPKDYTKSFEYAYKSAEKGYLSAQSLLGELYRDGHGVSQDLKMAFIWFQKAAEKGEKFAQNNLGFFYERGLGVRKDFSEAFEWYQKSAEQGDVFASFNLGRLYSEGLGFPKDYDKAIFWFQKAAEKGHEEAKLFLERLS